MSDDDNGLADDPRTGQQQGIEKAAQAIGSSDFRSVLPTQKAASQGIETSTVDEPSSQVEYYEAYGGELPHPLTLTAYPKEVQQIILDAYTEKVKCEFSDKSKRADLMANADIAAHKRAQVMSFVIDMTFVLASFVALIVTGNPLSLLGLAIPGGALFGNVVISVNANRKSRKQQSVQDETDNRDSGEKPER